MSVDGAIVERWIQRTLETYPPETLPFLIGEQDLFRNPVGHTLRENLATLVHELLGSMDRNRIASALDALVRLRAVQDFSPAEAVGFVFGLRDAVQAISGPVPETLQGRIDELALMAFDRYTNCREQIFELRINELRRWTSYASSGERELP